MNTKRKNTNQPTRVVIYVRISMSRDNQTSTRTQEKEAREYAAERNWEIIEPIQKDDGISAYSGKKRPGLDRAMQMIETGQANMLLVWKLDRIARSMIHFHELMGRINRAGGSFASVTDHIDSSTAGQIMMALTAGFAQMESDIKSDRTTSWQRGQIESGLPNGGQRTYGYEKQNEKQLPVIESEAAILREAATRILAGESIRSLIKELSPTSVTGDRPMTARGLRSALTNPTVAGLRRNGDDYATGNWVAILPRDQWDALNTLFGDPERRTGDTNQIKHLLSGIMECDRCGNRVGVRRWKANPTKRNPYVQESHRYTCKCGNSIDQASTDAVVMRRLWEIVTPQQWQEWRTTGMGWNESVINDIQRRYDIACEMQLLPPVKGQLRMSAEKLDETIAALEKEMALATGEEPLDLPDTDDPRTDWESLSVIDQRKIINQAFESVTLNESNGCRNPDTRISTL